MIKVNVFIRKDFLCYYPHGYKKRKPPTEVSGFLVHPKVSEEKQLITVFSKRSRQSKESETFWIQKGTIDYATRQVREPKFAKANFSSPMGTQKRKPPTEVSGFLVHPQGLEPWTH